MFTGKDIGQHQGTAQLTSRGIGVKQGEDGFGFREDGKSFENKLIWMLGNEDQAVMISWV